VGESINTSILIPLLPMIAALFIFVLLVSFNRTINRLTKPVSALVAISLLFSGSVSAYYYLREIEGEIALSRYLKFFEKTNLVIHLNSLNEKIIIFFCLIMITLIGFSVYKLPRKQGYVSFIISVGIVSSSVMLSMLLIDFSALT